MRPRQPPTVVARASRPVGSRMRRRLLAVLQTTRQRPPRRSQRRLIGHLLPHPNPLKPPSPPATQPVAALPMAVRVRPRRPAALRQPRRPETRTASARSQSGKIRRPSRRSTRTRRRPRREDRRVTASSSHSDPHSRVAPIATASYPASSCATDWRMRRPSWKRRRNGTRNSSRRETRPDKSATRLVRSATPPKSKSTNLKPNLRRPKPRSSNLSHSLPRPRNG